MGLIKKAKETIKKVNAPKKPAPKKTVKKKVVKLDLVNTRNSFYDILSTYNHQAGNRYIISDVVASIDRVGTLKKESSKFFVKLCKEVGHGGTITLAQIKPLFETVLKQAQEVKKKKVASK